jgi:excisionase family DNA binding protein
MQHTNDDLNLLTIPEAALQLRISTRTVARLIADGQLHAPKIRRRRLVSAASINGLLNESGVKYQKLNETIG